jgi:YHS domain-containing protein
MKQKAVKKHSSKESHKGSVFINVFTIVLFAGAFYWIISGIYYHAKNQLDSEDPYLSSLPDLTDMITHSKVCMVDDIYLGEGSFPVAIADKTYYGCSVEATRDLLGNQNIRTAKGPISKKKIDKATALIAVHHDKDGKVLYFESEETFKK